MCVKKVEDYVMVAVPKDIADVMGIENSAVLQYTITDGKLIIENVGVYDKIICNEHCLVCPLGRQDDFRDKEGMSVLEYIDSLTEEQKKSALMHLSLMWAIQQEKNSR